MLSINAIREADLKQLLNKSTEVFADDSQDDFDWWNHIEEEDNDVVAFIARICSQS